MHVRVIVILALLCGGLSCWGQPLYLVRDTILPAHPKIGTWFYDPAKHRSAYFGTNNWESFTENAYEDIFMCQAFMILQYNYSTAQLRDPSSRPTAQYCVRITTDSKRMTYCDHILCHDSIIAMIWDDGSAQLSANSSGIADDDRLLTSVYKYDAAGVKRQIVQNQEAYCAPDYIPKFNHLGEENPYRNWGMLGTNGKWIVPPIFDAPFKFVNGLAEVLYYGQKHKINEKGEFIK
jgi:hypothetical protein